MIDDHSRCTSVEQHRDQGGDTAAEADRRRSKAIVECLERVNAELPSASRVRSFRLVG